MKNKSGWQDLNLRPPEPHSGTLAGLRYIPKNSKYNCSNRRISTLWEELSGQFHGLSENRLGFARFHTAPEHDFDGHVA